MNRVSAEITQKVGMLLQDNHIHSHARQQEAQHHAGGPASHDAAARVRGLSHGMQYKRMGLYGESWNRNLWEGEKEKAVTLVML
jgi:hypothetical protein